jgi:uncharacterized protein YjbI with pentapeptide repeats
VTPTSLCHTASVRIDAPRVSPLSLADLPDAEPAAALDPAGTDGCRIAGAVLDAVTRTGVTYRETEFVHATASGARLSRCRFLDVRFDRLDAPDVLGSDSTWRRVELASSRVGTLGLDGSTVSGVRLDHCKIGFLGLQRADVHDLLIEHSSVDELDLTAAVASRVAVRDSRISHLRIGDARLSHVDLRQARLEEVDPVAGLRGAAITFEQLLELAPALARALGILVD